MEQKVQFEEQLQVENNGFDDLDKKWAARSQNKFFVSFFKLEGSVDDEGLKVAMWQYPH